MPNDLRQAFRFFRRSPGISLLAVFSLGIAMALNGALWSLRSGLLSQPTAPEPARLLTLTRRMFGPLGPGPILLTETQLAELAQANPVFERLAGYTGLETGCETGDGLRRTQVMAFTPTYFHAIGIKPFLGTLPGPGSPENGIVLSFAFWKRNWASDPTVLGRPLRLGGKPYFVAAVLAENHRAPGAFTAPEVYLPGVPSELEVLARPRSGFGLAQARTHLQSTSSHFFPPRAGETPMVISADPASVLPAGLDSLLSLALWITQALFLSVLGIALANVASLLLSRALERRRECALRLSLGATRGALMRMFLMEGLLLAAAGSALGLALLRVFQSWVSGVLIPGGLPIPFSSPFNPSVLGFSVLMLVMTGLLAGLMPARHAARTDLMEILKSGAGISRSSKAQAFLILAQAAASMLMLVVSCLFVLRLQHSIASLKGFETRHGLLLELDASLAAMSVDQAALLQAQALERLEALHGLRVGASSCYTPDGAGGLRREDVCLTRLQGEAWGQESFAGLASISPGYLESIDLRCIAGRGFTAADQKGAEEVALVNETFARHRWPGQSAVGQELEVRCGEMDTRCHVVGVVADHGLISIGAKPRPWVMRPLAQAPRSRVVLAVRTPGDPMAQRSTVLAALQGLGLPAENVRSLPEHFRTQLWAPRLAAVICGVSGLFALALACAGLYALMRQQVVRRRREIGLRMALGARLLQILTWMPARHFRPVLLGLLVGLLLAVVAAKTIGSTGGDTQGLGLACLGAALLLTFSALLACLVPAWRATRIPPGEALRSE